MSRRGATMEGMDQISRIAAFAAALTLTACSAHFPLNAPLDDYDSADGYRYSAAAPESSEEMLVALSFSGGGTRAAAFAHGVLEALRDTEIIRGGAPKRLLDEVDIITAVSGGSLPAAYFALYGDRHFDDFPRRVLERDLQRDLVRRTISPRQWRRLGSRYFDRIDLVAEIFGEEIYDDQTFASLEGRRPFLLINATDISLGVPFPFTQRRFDLLCSDLSSFPIGRAVAASAAVPVLFRPLTLKSYGWGCGYDEEEWIAPTLVDPIDERGSVLEGARRASILQAYGDLEANPWVHLVDGGVSDNLGMRSLFDSVFVDVGDGEASCDMLGAERYADLREVVVIAVNSVGAHDRSPARKENGPSLAQMVWAAVSLPIDRDAERTLDTLREKLGRWACRIETCLGRVSSHCSDEGSLSDADSNITIYPIVVGFEGIEDDAEREALGKLPTSFTLAPEDVDRLRRVAAEVLRGAPTFQRLIEHEDR